MNGNGLIKGRAPLPLLWLFAALVVAAGDLVPMHAASAPDVDFESFYIVSHPGFRMGLPGAFCLFGAIYLALALTPAIRVRPVLGYAHLGVMLVGAALIRFPAIALRTAGPPARYSDPVATFTQWNHMAAIGYGLSLASLLLFAYVVVDGWRRARASTP
jgi:heme/copper-type cytochrome/quinol oxidase subunit 1